MIQQLVMYEEELEQINNVCETLHRESNARAVLVIDKNGQTITQAGDVEQLDVTSLSSLTAGNVAATGGIAQLLSEKEFAGQFHEGEKTNVHISIVGARAQGSERAHQRPRCPGEEERDRVSTLGLRRNHRRRHRQPLQ